MKHRRFAPLAGGVAALAATFGVLADHPAVSTHLGTPVHAESFDRVIPIGPKTRWANVTRNETIKFVITTANEKTRSFVWRFDTLGTPVIELRSIAPPGTVDARHIDVSLRTRMTEAVNACRAVMTGSASVRPDFCVSISLPEWALQALSAVKLTLSPALTPSSMAASMARKTLSSVSDVDSSSRSFRIPGTPHVTAAFAVSSHSVGIGLPVFAPSL